MHLCLTIIKQLDGELEVSFYQLMVGGDETRTQLSKSIGTESELSNCSSEREVDAIFKDWPAPGAIDCKMAPV